MLFPPDLEVNKLFPGSNQYERFRRLVFTRLQPSSDCWGTHSIRKGSATYCTNGCTDGPSISSVYLRAGWKFPGVGDTYIKYQHAGDQHVGRVASGLPFTDSSFAILPPFFLNAPASLVEEALEMAFPTLVSSPLRTIAVFALASLVHQGERLKELMHAHHPVMLHRFFQHPTLMSTLRRFVICRNHKPGDPISPTGLPAYIIQLASMQEIPTRVLNLLTAEQFIFSPTAHQTARLDALTNQISSIANRIMGHASTTSASAAVGTAITASSITAAASTGPIMHLWGGRFHPVPQDFTIPNSSLLNLIQLWYNGCPRAWLS